MSFDIYKQESIDKIDYIEDELENALKRGGRWQGGAFRLCMGYVEEIEDQVMKT